METQNFEISYNTANGFLFVEKGEFLVEMNEENIEGLKEVMLEFQELEFEGETLEFTNEVSYCSAAWPEINIVKLTNEIVYFTVETEEGIFTFMEFTLPECWCIVKESYKHTLASETEFM